MKKSICILLSGLIILMSSCATILQGSHQEVKVTAEPADAKIYIDDEYVGAGYVIKKLRRNKTHIIMVKMDGYDTRYITVDTQVQAGWLLADFIFGILPMIIDAATGSWNKLDRTQYAVPLDKSK